MPVEVLYDTSLLPHCELLGIVVWEQQLCGIVDDCALKRRALPTDVIDIFSGDNRQLRFFAKDQDGNAVDLTGASALFTVKSLPTDTVPLWTNSTTVPAEGMLGTVTDGELFFFLVPAQTGLLVAGCQYFWDIGVTLSDGRFFTAITGCMNAKRAGCHTGVVDVYIGNNRTLTYSARDPNLNVIDLTGGTLVLSVIDADGTTVISKSTAVGADGAITVPLDGSAEFYLLPADTSGLPIAQYTWKVVLTRADGKIYTNADGVLNLLQSVG